MNYIMPFNDSLYDKLTFVGQTNKLINNIFNKTYKNTDDCKIFITENVKYKYDYINEIVEFLLRSDRFSQIHRPKIFKYYINFMLELPINPIVTTTINNSVMDYIFICKITILDNDAAEYAYAKTSCSLPVLIPIKPPTVKSSGICPYTALLEHLSTNQLVDNNTILNCALEYAAYMESHDIIKKFMDKCKLVPEHLNAFVKNYKGGI